MKLRNKKTGEIWDIGKVLTNDYPSYETLEQITEDFEDYIPPLIKNEKIRKAVRAWAEADDLDNFRVQNQHFDCCKIIGYTAGINKSSFIGLQTTIAHADSKKLYTIAELCGEEE